jgi:hypothetical protein
MANILVSADCARKRVVQAATNRYATKDELWLKDELWMRFMT